MSDDLSLDAFLEKIDDEDGKGFDPTGTTENEDISFLMLTLNDLLNEVAKKYPKADIILALIMDGYPQKEIFEKLNLGCGNISATFTLLLQK